MKKKDLKWSQYGTFKCVVVWVLSDINKAETLHSVMRNRIDVYVLEQKCCV